MVRSLLGKVLFDGESMVMLMCERCLKDIRSHCVRGIGHDWFDGGLGLHGLIKAERRISGKSFPSRHDAPYHFASGLLSVGQSCLPLVPEISAAQIA